MNSPTQDASLGTLRQVLSFKNLMLRTGAAPVGAFFGRAAYIPIPTIVGGVESVDIDLLIWCRVADPGPSNPADAGTTSSSTTTPTLPACRLGSEHHQCQT